MHWKAVDQCGNVTNLTIYARLIDTEEPVLIGVPDIACMNDPILRDIDAVDNCGQTAIHFWDIIIPNPCGNGTAFRRTYEVYDECGNMSRDTAILIPNDLNPPVIQFVNPLLADLKPGEKLEVNCSANQGNYTSFGVDDVSVISGCDDDASVTFEEKVIERYDCTNGVVAELVLEWTATDLCGNTSTRTIEASVVDLEAPVFINLVPELAIGCNDSLPNVYAIDNCSDVIIQPAQNIIHGPCPYEYDLVRHFAATDACGNSTTATQTIHVGNSNGPIISGVVPEICDDLSIPNVTAFDPCAQTNVDVVMTEMELNTSCREGRVIERIWSATDACGHTSEIHQIIIVNDQTPPEILIPTYSIILRFLDQPHNHILLSQTDLIRQLDALNAYSVFIEDECDEAVDPVFTLHITHADNCEEEGYWERREYSWMATDICGNASSLSFSVDILDDLPPVFTDLPEDLTVICQPLPPAAVVHTEDHAQPVNTSYAESILPGLIAGEYNVTRQWEATDDCGNYASASQHIFWIPDTHLACSIVAPGLVECNSHQVEISSVVSGGLGALTYQWEIFGDQCFIQGGQGTNTLYIYVGWSAVEIVLTVVDAYGCSTTCSTSLDCFDTSIDFNSGNHQSEDPKDSFRHGDIKPVPTSPASTSVDRDDIHLWPNPANESITISFEARNEEAIELRIFNLLGAVVYQDAFVNHKGMNAHSINVSSLEQGGYILQLRTKKEMMTTRFIILHEE